MFALAVVLLIAAAAIVLWVIMGLNGNNANDIHFNAPGIDTHIRPLTLFLLGALALLLIWAATRLFAAGTKRKYRQHKETKELKREHNEQEKLRQREEAEHQRELAARDRELAAAREREGNREVVTERETIVRDVDGGHHR